MPFRFVLFSLLGLSSGTEVSNFHNFIELQFCASELTDSPVTPRRNSLIYLSNEGIVIIQFERLRSQAFNFVC